MWKSKSRRSYIQGDDEGICKSTSLALAKAYLIIDEQQYSFTTPEDSSLSLSQDFQTLNVGIGLGNNSRDAAAFALSSSCPYEDSQISYDSSSPSHLSENFQNRPLYHTSQPAGFSLNSGSATSYMLPPPRPNTANSSKNFRSYDFDNRRTKISGNQGSAYNPRVFDSSGFYSAYESQSRPFEQPDISEEPYIPYIPEELDIQEEPEVSGPLQQYPNYSNLPLNYEVSQNRSIEFGYYPSSDPSFSSHNPSRQYFQASPQYSYDNADDIPQGQIEEFSEVRFAKPQSLESEVFEESYESRKIQLLHRFLLKSLTDNRSSSKQGKSAKAL
jgi:hypothetical protein